MYLNLEHVGFSAPPAAPQADGAVESDCNSDVTV